VATNRQSSFQVPIPTHGKFMNEQLIFLEHISDSILIQNDVGEIFFVNMSGIQALGLEESTSALQYLNANDALNIRFRNLLQPDSVLSESSLSGFSNVAEVYDLELVMPDGDTQSYRFNTKALNWNGSVVYFSSFKRVSGDNTMNQVHLLSQKLMHEILSVLPCAVIVTDFAKGHCMYANSYARSLVGYGNEELLEKAVADINIWADLEDRVNIHHELEQKGAVYDYRLFLRGKDGHRIPTSLNAHVIQSQQQPLLVAAVFDRTEELEKERSLNTSFEKLAESDKKASQATMFLTAVLNNIGQGVVVFDSDLNAVDWNETFLKILHFPDGFMKKGVNIREFFLRDARAGLHGEGDVHDLTDANLALLKAALQNRQFNYDWPLVDGSVVKISVRVISDGSFVVTVEDVTERRNQVGKIYKAAYSDSLTEIANRRAFDIELPEAQRKAKANKTGVILGLVDLDDFKNVNDIYGHAAGDAVLVECSSFIRSSIRETDLAVRLGGDEFAIIFSDTSDKNIALERLQHIVKKIDNMTSVGGCSINIGASAGMCLSKFGEMSDQVLFSKADEALYRAKKQGKGRVKIG